jgi:hypothetical protein
VLRERIVPHGAGARNNERAEVGECAREYIGSLRDDCNVPQSVGENFESLSRLESCEVYYGSLD